MNKIRNFRWGEDVDKMLESLVERSQIPSGKKRKSRNAYLIALIQAEHGAKQRDALQFSSGALQLLDEKEASE